MTSLRHPQPPRRRDFDVALSDSGELASTTTATASITASITAPTPGAVSEGTGQVPSQGQARREAAAVLQATLPELPGRRHATSPTPARAATMAQYGADLVEERLRYDRFDDDRSLGRQLAHESKRGITPAEYARINPFAAHHGLPPGWEVEDRQRVAPSGRRTQRTRLTGPNGECGSVTRTVERGTLYLNKAYKGTLPTYLEDVPGMDRPVPTINFLTARACRSLRVVPGQLEQITVDGLQHRPTLVHLEWLRRWHPSQSLGELISHTTWARSYIRETAEIFGQDLGRVTRIDEQGSPTWVAAQPGRMERDWAYTGLQNERKTIKYATGHKLPKISDERRDWRNLADAAVDSLRQARQDTASDDAAAGQGMSIDARLDQRLDAIRDEEQALARRYALPAGQSPRLLNFDVTFQTVRKASAPIPIPPRTAG